MTLQLHAHLELPGGQLDLDITDVDLAALDPDRRTAVLAGLHQVAAAILQPGTPTARPKPPTTATPGPHPAATLGPKPLRTRRGEHATPGSCEHAILTAVADAGGRYTGSLMDLARAHGTGAHSSSVVAARRAVTAGHLRPHRTGPRTVIAVYLTDAGWGRLGRTAPDEAPEATEPEAPAVPPPPAIPALGPIERRPFDPDAARAAAGDGV